MSKAPAVFVHAKTKADLVEYFDGAAAALDQYFGAAEESAVTSDDRAMADKVAAALEGVVHSSDTDCDYWACVMTGADPLDAPAFFGALGIDPGARQDVSGWDNPKLETRAGPAKGKQADDAKPTMQHFTGLGDDELETLDEYVSEDEQKAYARAASLLEGIGPVVGVQLCADDGVSKLRFTLAKSQTGAWVGVLTVRIET